MMHKRSGALSLELGDLEDFARGAGILGTGGGGDPYLGRLMLQQEMKGGRGVNIIPLSSLPDDCTVVACATMGAPTVMIEKIPNGAATVAAIRKVERVLGRKIDAVMPAEAGGINGTLPLVVGARSGLPVVDADGMGRAFPELQMVTFGIYGCLASPVVLASDHGDTVVIECDDNARAERLARAVVIAMGGQAQIAVFPMIGADAKRTAIPDTLRAALEIGRVVRLARSQGAGPVEALVAHLDCREPNRRCVLLFDGKIVDLRRETSGGFARGEAQLLNSANERLEIKFQNEYTIAFLGGAPAVMTPDLLCVLDCDTGDPVTTEGLKFGQRVKVLAWSAPAALRTPEAIAVVGPRAFGYDFDFEPMEVLLRSRLGAAPMPRRAHV